MNTHLTSNIPDFWELKNIIIDLWKRVRKEIPLGFKIIKKPDFERCTSIDILIEKLAREKIKSHYGEVNFRWEELPDEDHWGDITFIIDPLDGTESFIREEYNTVISIWVEYKGELIYGLVYDFTKQILYEWGHNSSVYHNWNSIPLQRDNGMNNMRILTSWVQEQVENIHNQLKHIPDLQITQKYGSVALQVAKAGAGPHNVLMRAGPIKYWDIAGVVPFIRWLGDTSIFSLEWEKFDPNTCESWIIVVRNRFKNKLFELLSITQ